MTSLARRIKRSNPAYGRPQAIFAPGLAREADRLAGFIRRICAAPRHKAQINKSGTIWAAKMARTNPRLYAEIEFRLVKDL